MGALKFILLILLCVPLAYLAVILIGSLLDEGIALKRKGSARK